jgi:hypothetical protein
MDTDYRPVLIGLLGLIVIFLAVSIAGHLLQ